MIANNLIRIDVGWIIIGEIRWSTTSLVTDCRCQRKVAEEDERECEGQHQPTQSLM